MNVSKHATIGQVGDLPFYPPSSYPDAEFCFSVIERRKSADKVFKEMILGEPCP